MIYANHERKYQHCTLKELQTLWAETIGKPAHDRYLLSESVKIAKGQKEGYLTGVQYMSANVQIGNTHTCTYAKKAGCGKMCLIFTGHMSSQTAEEARGDRLDLLIKNPSLYFELLSRDVIRLEKRAERKSMRQAGRQNGTTDLDWTRIRFDGMTVFEHFPNVKWYDYTKNPDIVRNYNTAGVHVTFSWYRKASPVLVRRILDSGTNVAITYYKGMPDTQKIDGRDFEVINGDEHDLRFLDKRGVVVGLEYKLHTFHKDAAFRNRTALESGFIIQKGFEI